MEKYEGSDIFISFEDFLEDTDNWCDLKKMYFYALALAIAKRVFEVQPGLDSLSYFSKFAYDVVVDFLNQAESKELQNDLMTAKASLNRLLAETEEDACNCERMKNGAFLVSAVMHEAIVSSIDYIADADLEVLNRDLSSMELNPKDQTCFSPFIENYATLIENIAIDNLNDMEDELDKSRERWLLEDMLDPIPEPEIDQIVGRERKPTRTLCYTIPALTYFYESKDRRHYYKNKLRKMYDAVESTEMTNDDYEAIIWCLANWNWYAAKLFTEGKLELACSIAYAVLTESVKGFSNGKLLEKITTDKEYERSITWRVYDTRTLYSHFLRHCKERYVYRTYTTFMNMEDDPALTVPFVKFEMSSVSRAAARVLNFDY